MLKRDDLHTADKCGEIQQETFVRRVTCREHKENVENGIGIAVFLEHRYSNIALRF